MRLQSPEYRASGMRAAIAARIIDAALALSAVGLGVTAGISPSLAQEAANDVAYVEAVSGRVVAFSRGNPVLLDTLDLVDDRTRLDLQANSELRICHYRTERLLTLTGPSRAAISADGISVETGKAAAVAGTCAAPVISNFQGGLVARGLATLDVPLQPSIKVVNRGSVAIAKVALWDGAQRTVVGTFARHEARPVLEDGQSYLLVVERGDGSELKMKLKGSAAIRTGPVIVVLP